jgi:hypothetical protein
MVGSGGPVSGSLGGGVEAIGAADQWAEAWEGYGSNRQQAAELCGAGASSWSLKEVPGWPQGGGAPAGRL